MSALINTDDLKKVVESKSAEYQSGKPFPHIYIDNVFNPEVLDKILAEFPRHDEIDWQNFNNPNEKKLASRDEMQFGDVTRQFIHELNSAPFLRCLEKLTGIDNLIPDPGLEGGGLHQIMKGGLLKVHADFNVHPKTNLDRRLNLLIYLNKDWKEEYGGHFELWDKTMSKAEVKILPVFNRMALFSTTSDSYHGHPDELKCPEDRSRKSIALYYYTNGRPEHEKVIGLERHSTLFVNRKGESEVKADNIGMMKFKGVIKRLIPPIITDMIKKMK
jgi:Predicted proline hydroxylase